jgi:ribosome maturation factor RimP
VDTFELESRIEKLVLTFGLRLISARWQPTKRRAQLRVMADGEDRNITINDCADISRAIKELLDQYPHEFPDYRLEVSSPGLGHPLQPWQFRKNLGRVVEAKYEKNGKHLNFTGNLYSVDELSFTIEGDKESEVFEYSSTEVYVLPVIKKL